MTWPAAPGGGAGQGPLRGVRVVELAGIGPAQHGCMLLADLGADVLRVDRPGGGDAPGAGVLDRGRRSVTLDLKAQDDLRRVRELIGAADVLVDPYRPGVLERIGLDPVELLEADPRLVVARMTGWGQDGPLARAAGHDINYVALTGALEAMGAAGEPPPVPLNVVGDFGGGSMVMAFGVAAALFERERSGQGQVVDVAMVDGIASLMAGVLHLRGAGQWRAGRGENWLQGAAPWYRTYATADGTYVSVGPLEGKFYAQLLRCVGLDPEDWPQWDEARWSALAAELERAFAARPVAAWRAELEGTDVCFAPVLALEDAAQHPHLRERGTFVLRDGVVEPGVVPRFGRTPGAPGPAGS